MSTSGSLGKQEASFFEDPISFELPLFTDTGTSELQKETGHATDTCGDIEYTLKSPVSWVKKDSSNPRLFTLDLNSDFTLIGVHKL